MIKIVLDTNVFVSALLTPNGKPELIIRLVFAGQAELYLTEAIFEEYAEVLARKKFKDKIAPARLKEAKAQLRKISKWIEPQKAVHVLTDDPDDNIFLECALECKADFLITGNTKHFPFSSFHETKIVSPDEFIQAISKKIFGYL